MERCRETPARRPRQNEQADRYRSEAPVFHPGDRVWLPIQEPPSPAALKEAESPVCGDVQGRPDGQQDNLETTTPHYLPDFTIFSCFPPQAPGPLADDIPHDTPRSPLDIEGSPVYAVRSLLD